MHNFHRLNIKQGILLLFLSSIIFSFNSYSQQPSFIVKKIWDKAPHNAFTDLIRFDGKFYCTFREANSHAIRTSTTDFGRIRVLISMDGEDWQSFALIEKNGYDLRDPSWSITPAGKLMLLMAGSLYDGVKIASVHCQVSFFDQTKNSFSDPKPVKYDKKINSDLNWLWRITWFKGKAYGVVYQFDKGISQSEIYLVESKDGIHYSLVTPLEVEGTPSETAINITPEGKLALLVRRDGKNEDGLYAESNYPFKKWNWVHTGYRLGGPRFIFGPGGEMLIGTRTFSKKGDWLTGLLVSDSTGRFRQIFEFPSKGDCSYPGMLIYNEILYFSYYSSHQGKPSIYLAKIPISLLQTMIQVKNDRNTEIGKRWTIDKARNWYNQHEWISGSDFIPSTAVNQLEMWQAPTFDPETIDKELGWAENIGFNTMRVYLHSLAWEQDSYGFKQRVGQYLDIADKHKIKTIFVFFDDCWNKVGAPGKQPSPKTGIHNSGWVQDPGDPNSKDSTKFPLLERYVKDVMNYFSGDTRILLWDLYNEPGNSGKLTSTLPLLKKIFKWAREVNPDQPISAGLWNWSFNEFNDFQALNSDIITYHDYQEPLIHQNIINLLKTHGRPLICTEYMARTLNSRFSNILPMLKRENVGAINWGLVSGKTNTIFAWDKPLPDGGQPVEWFHDIFRNDGTPYQQNEVDLIKQINGLNKDNSIIPKPLSLVETGGKFIIGKNTKIYVDENNSILIKIGEMLAARLKLVTGFEISVSEKSGNPAMNAIILTQNDAVDTLGTEGYNLAVSSENIIIKSLHPAGVFYGMQTLLQLLPVKSEIPNKSRLIIPGVQITDKPRFGWRGMMLDVGRYFYSTDFIKKYIDYLAMHKLNTFHWHLTEDHGWRIEIKKYPKLTQVGAWRESTQYDRATSQIDQNPHGGFYTQDQIREIVAYANDRFVNIVPEIEMPGHSLAALVAYPELSCTGGPFEIPKYWDIQKDVYCAGNEETFKFLEDVLTEVADLFPGPVIHIGGDECPKDRWKLCPKCQARIKAEGLKDEHELQSYFIRRIEKFLLTKNKRIIGWDEILEGGLAPNAMVMSWRGVKGGIEAARQHHEVVMSPYEYTYFDYYQGEPYLEPVAFGGLLTLEKVYSYEPVPAELDTEEAQFIKGVQANVWSEFIHSPEKVEYMSFPRAAALAEVGWTDPKLKNWEDFKRRMAVQYKRYESAGINYSKSALNVTYTSVRNDSNRTAIITLKTNSYQPEIRYTTDSTEPTVNSSVYFNPFIIKLPGTIKAAVFENGLKISKVSVTSVLSFATISL